MELQHFPNSHLIYPNVKNHMGETVDKTLLNLSLSKSSVRVISEE